MHRLICSISCNNHQVNRIELKIFYGDLGISFYVYIKLYVEYITHMINVCFFVY